MNQQAAGDPRLEPRHSIAVVSRRTGITQLVLRAWERRYGAVVPARTPTGRRRYSDADLEKLALLAKLTDSGHRIGDVAALPLAELHGLVRESAADPMPRTGHNSPADSPLSGPSAAPVAQLLDAALEAVTALDARGLEAVLNRALVDLSKPELRSSLLVPLLVEIGNRWQDGKLRIAHEHMATSIVAAFLTALNARSRAVAGAPLLAVATPAGQVHELGTLLAAGHAQDAGWEVLYLGPNLPAEEIAAAVRSRGAQAVLLGLVFPHGDPGTASELRELRRLVGPDLPLLVGGQAAPSYAAVLAEVGARVFGAPVELERALALF